jgi:hypothetical protein
MIERLSIDNFDESPQEEEVQVEDEEGTYYSDIKNLH